MDDALLVRVLHAAADAEEELEPLAEIEAVPVAVVGDRLAGDELHDEVGQPLVGGAGVEHAGDVGVVHHRERLPLALEAREHLVGVHPEADHLEGDGAAEGLELLGLVDGAHAALAEDADDAVGTDAVGVRGARGRGAGRRGRLGRGAGYRRRFFGEHPGNLPMEVGLARLGASL